MDNAAIAAQVALQFQELVNAAGLVAPPAAQPDQPPAVVGAIAIKLPPFWTTRPEVWFAQCEAQFATRNVTAQLTKFYYVVAALDNTTAAEVEALILQPPAENPYDRLKADLIKAFGRTQQDKDMALLNLAGLGDRKPSALLRYMTSLNSDPATLFRALFLMQLPVEVRRVLAIHTTASMEALADEADRIMAAGKLSPVPVGAIDHTSESPSFTDVAAVGQRGQQGGAHGGVQPAFQRGAQRRSQRPPGGSLANAGLDTNGVCAYHARFNADAVRCVAGCRYARHVISPTASGNGNTNRR